MAVQRIKLLAHVPSFTEIGARNSLYETISSVTFEIIISI